MTVKITRPSIDIRGTLDELNKPSGIAGNAMLAAETPQEQFNLIGAGRKNLLINGSVQVWQKGTTQTKSNSYSNTGPDHMTTYYGGTYAQQSVVLPSGQEVSALRYTADTSSNACPNFNWIMEDAGKILRGQTVTISWWMRTSKPGIMMGARVNNVANSRYSGGGSYYTLGQTSGFIYEATTSWTYHSRTVALSDANTHAHGLAEIWAAGGSMSSGDWFEIAQVQLELGSVATPFEHRSYGEELALCQRYYERINGTSPWFFGHGYNSQVYMTVEWKVPKRVSGGTVYYSDQGAPASMFTLYGNTGSSGAIDGVITSVSLSNAAVTALSFYLSLSSSANTPYGTSVMWRLDSARWIAYDAEI